MSPFLALILRGLEKLKCRPAVAGRFLWAGAAHGRAGDQMPEPSPRHLMQAALALEAEEAVCSRSCRAPLGGGARRRPRGKPSPQRVVGVELFEIVEDVLVAPVDHWQELEATALDGQHWQVAPAAGCSRRRPGEPGLGGTQLGQGGSMGSTLLSWL